MLEMREGAAARAWVEEPEFLRSWRDLAAGGQGSSPFLSPAFIRSFYDTLPEGQVPVIVRDLAGPSKRAAGLCFWVREGRVFRPAGGALAYRCPWLSLPLRGPYFLDQMLNQMIRSGGAEMVRMDRVRAASEDAVLEAAWATVPGLRIREAVSVVSPSASRTSRSTGEQVRRHYGSRAVNVELIEISDAILLARLSATSEAWIQAQRQVRGTRPSAETEASLRHLLSWAQQPGSSLVASVMQVDGQPMSTLWCVRDGARVYVLRAAASEEDHSPMLLHFSLLEHRWHAEGVKAVEWKGMEDWLSGMPHQVLQLDAWIVTGSLRWKVQQGLRRFGKRLSQKAVHLISATE
jgi:hypothetical protein